MIAKQAPERVAVVGWVRAILVIFLMMGFGFGTWLSRLPGLRDGLGASTLEMSIYGLCLAGGSLGGMVVAGNLIERIGSRRTMTIAVAVQVIALPGAGALMLAGLVPLGLVVLAVYGVTFSTADIAMNVSGASAERAYARPRMPLMHAFYSIGMVLSMGAGAAAEALRVSLPLHFVLAAVFIGAGSFAVLRLVPLDESAIFSGEDPVARRAPAAAADAGPGALRPRYSAWRDKRVLLIGLITLSAGLVEGTPADWLPLALVDGRGISNELGAVMLGVFFGSVVTARLFGSAMLNRFSRVAVLRASFVCSTIGILTVLLVPSGVGVVLGTIAWGLGTGVCWPITISAAADDPRTAARSVAAVSAIGYTSMLLGPMAFGLLGEHIGLLQAFWVLPLFTLLALLLSGATRPRE